MSTINSHSVEFSIAGGVAEIVHDPSLMPLFFSFSLLFFIMRSLFLGTRSFVQR